MEEIAQNGKKTKQKPMITPTTETSEETNSITYKGLKSQGIPVKEAVIKFKAVKGYDGVNTWAEMAFYSPLSSGKPQTNVKSRIAKMWLCPGILICEQPKDWTLAIPLGNVAYMVLL